MAETIQAIAKAYEVGVPDSLVIVIPKALRNLNKIRKGTRYLVKTDERKRIIYEPIEGAK